MIERIQCEGSLLAVILPRDFREPGIHFLTPDELSQQLAFMRHPAGKVIEAHVHHPVPREVQYSQEVLLIRKGRLRVWTFTTPLRVLCSERVGMMYSRWRVRRVESSAG